MRMVRLMCDIKLQDRVPSKGLRDTLGLDDNLILQQNRLQFGMGKCCEKKTMIG